MGIEAGYGEAQAQVEGRTAFGDPVTGDYGFKEAVLGDGIACLAAVKDDGYGKRFSSHVTNIVIAFFVWVSAERISLYPICSIQQLSMLPCAREASPQLCIPS
jgi:hypothetical protein